MRTRLLCATAPLLFAIACAPDTAPGDDDSSSTFDADGDGFTPAGGDCDDSEDSVYPGAPELDDDLDNDCDGEVDDDLPTSDDDGDGYSNVEGDCDDSEELVNPGAVEVNETVDANGNIVPEGIDNDCDGQIDEGATPCDDALGGNEAVDFAHAIELCDYLVGAEWYANIPAPQRAIRGRFGTQYNPHAGHAIGVISTGRAVDPSAGSWEDPLPGHDFGPTEGGIHVPHPDYHAADPGDPCSFTDPSVVNDYLSITLTIRTPTNAQALMFDFAFMSAEFPTYVCSSYDDTFLAMLDTGTFHGNVSFDDQGRPVTINSGFFDVCTVGMGPDCTGNAELAGTGFEQHGGTGWLHTIAPVTPGETITLTFHLFDEGDGIYDSLVLIDNFQWLGVPVDGPITIP
jgi:hypothetical protein